MKWIKRKHAIGIAVAVVCVIAISTMVFIWRATTGPVSLGFLTPRLEAMINAGLKDIQLRFNDSIIEWSDGNKLAYLQFIDVEVVDRSGNVFARVPRANVTLSGPALLGGTVAPTRVELIGATASIARRSDGTIQLGLHVGPDRKDEPEKPGEDSQGVTKAILEAMLHPTPDDTLSRYLKRFAITGAKLSIFDQETKSSWNAENASLTFDRKSNGVVVAVNAPVKLADKSVWGFTASARYANGSDSVTLEAAFKPVRLSLLAASGAGLKALSGVNIPVEGNAQCGLTVSGTLGRCKLWLNAGTGLLTLPALKKKPIHVKEAALTVEMDFAGQRYAINELTWKGDTIRGLVTGNGAFRFGTDGALEMLSADWTAENVFIDAPNVFEGGLALESARFRGAFDAAQKKLTIDEILARRGSFELKLAGALQDDPVSMGVALTGQAKDLSVADLKRLWPSGAAPGAREWILASVHEGMLKSALVNVAILPGAITGPAIPDEMVNIALDIHDMRVTYLEGLPDLAHISGSAILSGDKFRAEMTSGSIGAIRLKHGNVAIDEIHRHGTTGYISGDVAGPTKDILLVLDNPRLGYPTRYGINAAKAGGSTEAHFDFSIPMLRDVSADAVGIEVGAELSDVKLPFTERLNFTGGKFSLKLNGKGLKAHGAVQLNGAAVGFIWSEDFTGTEKFGTHIDVTATLNTEQRERFGIKLSPYVEGRSGVVATLTGSGGKIRNATFEANLTASRLSLPQLNWAKPEDANAIAKASVEFKPGDVIELSGFELTGQGMKASGRMTVGNGALLQAEFKKLQLGPRNDMALSWRTAADQSLSIDVKGKAADAGGVLEMLSSESAGSSQSKVAWAPMSVRADVGAAHLLGGASYNNVKFAYADDSRHLTMLNVDTAADAYRVKGELTTAADGSRKLRMTSADSGRLLRGLTGFRSIIGGAMTLSADLTPLVSNSSGAGADSAFDGSLRIDNFKLVDQPFVARLLSAGSFTGLDDLMRGEGITFSRLEQTFHGRGDVITLSDGRAAGPAIGLTAQGMVDRGARTIDLNGTIVPLYGLNSIFEDVPLIGDILGSRNGEGIFGVTYGIKGELAELKVSVNPISMLAPGFLRKLFQMGPTPQAAAPMPLPMPQQRPEAKAFQPPPPPARKPRG